MNSRPQLVVLHALTEQSNENVVIRDVGLASALRRYGDVTFVNVLAVRAGEYPPARLVVVSDSIMTRRGGATWSFFRRIVQDHAGRSAAVALITQDDYQFPDRVASLAQSLWATIFTALGEIYASMNVQVRPWPIAMTDKQLDTRLREFIIPWENRQLDLATRVNRTSIRYGNEARKKASVSIRFGAWATEMGYQVDVSDETGKRLVGKDWWSFLANSRFTVGRPSGASRITRSIRDVLYEKAILSVYSNDSFEGQLARFSRRATETSPMLSESPRYLESSGLLVAQILEGENQPIGMLPWEHFVPLNSDWSNLSEIGRFMSSTEGLELATRCRDYIFGAKALRSEFWYGSMAEHFSLTPLPVGESGKLCVSAVEIARRAAVNELVKGEMESGMKSGSMMLRRFLRTTESPATVLLYPWKSVGVDDL